jgi:hypothetical protein
MTSHRNYPKKFQTESEKISTSGGSLSRVPKNYRVCIPWAVVEVKCGDIYRGKKRYGYLQLANSASMSMLENLLRDAKILYEAQNMPPVVGFTFVGPDVRSWIIYHAENGDNARSAHPSFIKLYF